MRSGKLLLSLSTLLFSLFCHGQVAPDLEQGMKPYGSYHGGDLDHISLSNGNLFFQTNLLTYSQRAEELAYPIVLQYNNENFSQFQQCQQGQQLPQCQINIVFGPQAFAPQGANSGNAVWIGFEGTPTVAENAPDPGFNTGLVYYGNPIYVQTYSVMMPDGSVHQLVNTNTGKATTDGSGYFVDSAGTLHDRSGTKYLSNGVIEDANGNQMNLATGKDTLGRQIPAFPGPANPAATPPSSTVNLATCPTLNYSHQPVTYAYMWNLPTINGGTLPLTLCYASVYVRTNFFGGVNSSNWHELSQNFTMLQSVVFPDSTYWAFEYDAADPNNTSSIALADLLKVKFPTGGSIAYTWSGISGADMTNRAVQTRSVDANDGAGPKTWQYIYSNYNTVGGTITLSTTVQDPLGNQTVHTLTGVGGKLGLFETATQYYQGPQTSGTLLKTVETDYQFTANPWDSSIVGGGSSAGAQTVTNIFPIRVTTTLANGLVSKTETDYDTALAYHGPLDGITYNTESCYTDAGGFQQCSWSSPSTMPATNYTGSYGKVTATREYDWGQGSPGPLLRQTFTNYLWQSNSNYLTYNFLDLVSSSTVQDGSGNQVAKTTYGHDEYPLNSSGVATQFNSSPANGGIRGNQTSMHRWLNGSTTSTPNCAISVNNGYLVTYAQYNDTGTVYKSVDACGTSASDANHTTTHIYDLAYAGAYSTKTCNPLGQCVSGTYDINTGLLTSFTDANASYQASGTTAGDPAHTTNYSYDSRWRLTSATLPADPAGNHPQTTFNYPNATTVERLKKISASLTDDLYSYFDGLGRPYKSVHASAGNATVVTTYDAFGRVASVTNPYFTTSDATYGVIQTQYDALGRITQTTKQDGSATLMKYDLQTANTNCTLATDETGKPRYACSDALGRLVEVQEPGASSVFTPGWSRVLQQWGAPGDIPVPGDYDGDGITDFAIWRPSNGTWYVMRSSDGTIVTQQWGNQASGDVPVPGDYDGDGKTDYAIWRASTGTWWVLRSSDGGTTTQQWGNQASGDVPVPGDYDGDRKTDFAVWRASTGVWYVLRSSDGGTTSQQWGNQASGDTPVPGDYDGDKKADFAVWRSSTGVWYVLRSSDGGTTTELWGASGDKPAQGDYDGDGKTDFAVWRPSTATWYLVRSSDGRQVSEQWGTNGDMPVAASFQGGRQTDFAVWNPTTGMWSVSLSYVTFYSYDTLGNLISVTQQGDGSQGARMRTFTYNSLAQLLTANNPESGLISYSYDANGNVLQKTSPAPNQSGTATQTISYCYDKLNRIIGKQYAATACPLSSPAVTYNYDAGINGIGHLTSLTDQAGSGSYSFDALGRIASEQRTIAGIQKSLSYVYYLDNSVNALTYPSGAVVTYTADAAGRVLSAVDNGNNVQYVTNAIYGADNSLTGFVSGYSGSFSGISNNFSYNNRLQPVTISATAPNNQTVFSLGYDFHFGNGDNGNVYAITNNRDSSRSQTFTYDALNRLTSAQNAGTDCTKTTVNNKTEYWGNSYGYDPWGNLTKKTPTKCSAESLNEYADWNNRLHTYSGTDNWYDAAGNMTHDATTGLSYTFDAENRITGAGGYTYIYDAEGNRVEKSNGSAGTIYWSMLPGIMGESDLSGNLQSEYVFFAGERVARKDLPSGAVSYYFSDHLKTASMITNAVGNTQEDEDYYPWGSELQLVNNDSNHYKFTGKERDAETGLDYFGARYYGNWLGRFTIADPIWVKGDRVLDPQRLNLYSYARNNPVRFKDPTGMDITLGKCSGGANKCFDMLQKGLKKEDRSHVHLVQGDGKNGFKKGTFGVTVDADYKSTSGNFTTLQKLANDHTAVGVVDVLGQGDSTTVRIAAGWDKQKGTTMADSPLTMNGKSDPFQGYTFFQFRGRDESGIIYTPGDYSEVVLNSSGLSDTDVTANMYHELTHLLIGDFGRSAEKAKHSPTYNSDEIPHNEADRLTKAAEQEARTNASQP
jgi:RHS repeat-associated protein